VSAKKQKGQIVRAAGVLLMTPQAETVEFLLMRHPDRWDLPKGRCEEGESFEETALRETEEETGIPRQAITLDPGFHFDLAYPVTYKKSRDQLFQKQVRYFLAYLETKPELELTEHESAEWFLWNPPHKIQSQSVDPLLAAVERYLAST
jgi:8-oxo-dGTP pyrophosphatase MutT (NUDIX family)